MDISYEIEPRLFAGALSCVSPHSATSPSGGEDSKAVSFEPDGSILGTDGKRIFRAKGAFNGMMTFAPFFLFFNQKITIPKKAGRLRLRIHGLKADLVPDPGVTCEASLTALIGTQGDTRKWAGTVQFRQPDAPNHRWQQILARELAPTRIPEEALGEGDHVTAFDPTLLADVAKTLGAVATKIIYRPQDRDCMSIEVKFLPADEFSRVTYVQARVSK